MNRNAPGFLRAALLIISGLASPLPAMAGGFTSADVAAATARLGCVDWRIRGICLKLQCGFFGCRVRSRPWVEHRIPDLVVSVYNEPGDLPWVEARATLGALSAGAVQTALSAALGGSVAGGQSTASRPDRQAEGRISAEHLRFKEASVIGNPGIAAWNRWLATRAPLVCPSPVEPARPYFASELDALSWRTGLAEMLYPEAWQPAARVIGEGVHRQWGTVYPRQGTIRQSSDVLAGAVIAQRSVDIVTRSGQPHVYQPVPGIPASDEQTDHWQMVWPHADRQCTAFGRDRTYADGRENPSEGGYGWIYWPLHHCCPGSGRTLARIRF